jgi:hypothetical protein
MVFFSDNVEPVFTNHQGDVWTTRKSFKNGLHRLNSAWREGCLIGLCLVGITTMAVSKPQADLPPDFLTTF